MASAAAVHFGRAPLTLKDREKRNRRADARQSATSRLYYHHELHARGLAACSLSRAGRMRRDGLPGAARNELRIARALRLGTYYSAGLRLRRFAEWSVLA